MQNGGTTTGRWRGTPTGATAPRRLGATRVAVICALAVALVAPAGRADALASGSSNSASTVSSTGRAPTTTYDPISALGSMYNVVDQINARRLWKQGVTGDGIDVAVIDTGIAPVPALTGGDKVVGMVDLSFEATVPEAVYLDTFGHGSHMAGIIAGRDPGADPATADQRPGEFLGVAPGAGLVSVKVGDNTGAVDVSQVIGALDWVVEHRRAGGWNIRVVNLSYATDAAPSTGDPLFRAVERAWKAGIVVVVAGGNDGWNQGTGGLGSPARDRYVLAVGGAEATSRGMTIPKWSSPGEYSTGTKTSRSNYWQPGYTGRIPDVVAPGAHIDSLRVPGSRIATEHPEGFVTESIFRGSGSSQAAAVVSGAVALLLDARPELGPDQVKALLRASAVPIPNWGSVYQGSGVIDVAGAASLPAPGGNQTWPTSSGLGSLELARGTQHVTVGGAVVQGEVTAWGSPWNAQAWLDAASRDATWTDGTWNGASWTGASWTGASWTGASWTGASWTGASWTGASWTGASWTGASWTGASWTGASWTESSWTGARWTGTSWTGARWTGARWKAASWT